MWLPAKLRCAKHFFLLQWHFASISLGLGKLFIHSFDFLSFIGSGLTCLSVSYCLLGQDSHVWWFYNWMERPSNTIHLICNISSRRYRHFIFREWRNLRRFIFRRGETYISDIRKNGHFIFLDTRSLPICVFQRFVINGLKVTIFTTSRLFSFLASGGI